MSKTIIGFAGRKRSGKGELSNVLVENHNAKIITVANYLKELCAELMGIDITRLNELKDNGTRFSYDCVERWINLIHKRTGIDKEIVEKEIGNRVFGEVREMLQVIGTDLIRKYSPNWHVDQMVKDIESYGDDAVIAIDDVRFPNEREAIEKLGGEVFFIVRPSYLDVSNHVSETSLTWMDFNFDHIIINNRILEHFRTLFLMLFNNDFNVSKNGMLVSDSVYNTDIKHFGLEKSEIVESVLEQVKDSELFKTDGTLKFVLNDEQYKTMKSLFPEIQVSNDKHITITNPLVTENFKLWL